VKSNVIIIGGGQAGCMTAIALRKQKYKGSILIVNSEDHLPYQRPPLSKGFLLNQIQEDSLYLKTTKYFEKNNIKIKKNTTVSRIDTKNKKVVIDDFEIAYDVLSISTGSILNKLSVSCNDESIHYLRNISDAKKIRDIIKTKQNIVVVGAGYIGLEIAASSRKNGLNVTVLEKEDRIMKRAVCSETSNFIQKKHEEEGVKFIFNTSIQDIEDCNNMKNILFTDGKNLATDAVIVGVGVRPNQQLAMRSEIECDNGIIINEYGRTSINNIYAAGDCTNHPNNIYKEMLRLESVHNAIEQGKTVASSINGKKVSYEQVPWFWSDQYNLKIQIAGIFSNYEECIVKKNTQEESLAVFYMKNNKLIAIDAINNHRIFSKCKKIIASGSPINSNDIDRLWH
tara:strand:- start:507 stop:1697 length:1191 start_codon:yes stop_codon:yes gene_type:complete